MATEPSLPLPPKTVPLTCHGHSRPVPHLSFSALDPTSTSSSPQYYLISACKDNFPMLRNGVTGDWIGTFVGHKGAVWQARLSADASLAATASADFSAKVWDTTSGEALATLEAKHICRAVAFPGMGVEVAGQGVGERPRWVATAGAEKRLKIWDIERAGAGAGSVDGGGGGGGAQPNGNAQGVEDLANYEVGQGVHQGTIKSIVWGADPNVLVTAADDKMVRWWDLRSRTSVAEHGVDGLIGSCELNGTGGVLSVAAGKGIYFFDGTQPGSLLKKMDMKYEVASAAVNMEQRRFVTGSTGDTWVRVHDLDTGEEIGKIVVSCIHYRKLTTIEETGKGHHGPVWSVAFSPDGKIYATGSEDGTIKLWKFTTGPYGLWR
ncbi:MAG: hypothetical protein M1821_003062 [Bathelium mastoideum]|nr:MAG: hypothetical protein M1821_003062 [Bathelium mastoideum]